MSPPGSDLRIMMWFGHFSMSGMTGFKYGAFALAHYALAHRDEVRSDDMCIPNTCPCH